MSHRTLLSLGGSLRSGSLTTSALRLAADHARDVGGASEVLTVDELALPLLDPDVMDDPDGARPAVTERLLDAVARADALVVGTPVYGGTASGAVKNLLDTLHLGKVGNRGPLAGKRIGVLSVGGGSLTGRFEFQRGATGLLAVACRNLGGWVESRHVELSELAFDVDGRLVDALARAQVVELVDRLLGRGAPDEGPPDDRLTGTARATSTGLVSS